MPLAKEREIYTDFIRQLEDLTRAESYSRFITNLDQYFEEYDSSRSYYDFIKSINYLNDKHVFASESEYVQILKDATTTFVAKKLGKEIRKGLLTTFKKSVLE